MSESGDSFESGSHDAREPRSTLYVIGSSTFAALILGLTIFLLIRGFQWRGALADLRAEPGIEILSVERVGFFKKRLLGLRDPLAPTAESILVKHNIGPHSAEVVLTEYYSLNTAYGKQRAEEEQARFDALKQSLVTAVGEFAESLNQQRESDLEKITRMLFEAKFPAEMESVDLKWDEGSWKFVGELYGPQHTAFVGTAPDYLVEGEPDFSGLDNLTESLGSSLREQIESTNLFATDIDGNLVHLDRIARLIGDFDEVAEKSDVPPPRLQLEISAAGRENPRLELDYIREQLCAYGHIEPDRFLPDLALDPPTEEESPVARIKLIPIPAS